MKPLIGICAGHCRQQPGAINHGFDEQNINRIICNQLQERLDRSNVDYYDPESDLKEYPDRAEIAEYYPELAPKLPYKFMTPKGACIFDRVKKYNDVGATIAIDLHLNSFPRKRVNYVAAVHHPLSDNGKMLAGYVSQHLRSALKPLIKLPSHCMEDDKRRPFLTLTKMPAVYGEPLFLSNGQTIALYVDNWRRFVDRIAVGYHDGIIAWMENEYDNGDTA